MNAYSMLTSYVTTSSSNSLLVTITAHLLSELNLDCVVTMLLQFTNFRHGYGIYGKTILPSTFIH